MVNHAVEEEAAARLQRHHRIPTHLDLRITDLPIPPFEVYHRPLPVTAGNHVHAAVFDGRFVEGDPHTYNRGTKGYGKVGVILMLRLLPTAGGLKEGLVSEELGRRPAE